jgi:hypothetical protein
MRFSLRKQEHLVRRARPEQRVDVVMTREQCAAIEELGISAEKLGGILAAAGPHPLVDERQIRPGDGLVVPLRRAVRGRESAQGSTEAPCRFGEIGVSRQVDERGAHVLAVAELPVPQLRRLEGSDERVVGQCLSWYHGTKVTHSPVPRQSLRPSVCGSRRSLGMQDG